MAKFLNDGTFEEQLKKSTLEQLFAHHDFCVMVGNKDRCKQVDEEILKRQKIEDSNEKD